VPRWWPTTNEIPDPREPTTNEKDVQGVDVLLLIEVEKVVV
jgi:hypothetical protein